MSEKKITFQHTGHYVCECGREFEKSQSYNAHLSHCKIHLGEEKYNARLLQQKLASVRGNEVQNELKANLKKEKYLTNKQEWESTVHYCEKCGKELPHNYEDVYATGRFCCQACANSRTHSLETIKKISINSALNSRSGKMSLCGHYKGYYCASSYELIFLVYCLDTGIMIERNKFTFPYTYEGKQHIYIPDWYLPETDTIIECKGFIPSYNDELVKLKSSLVTNHNYRLLYEDDLQPYWNYCKVNYKVKTYKDLCNLLYE